MKSVHVGSSVSIIEKNAFLSCNNLTTVITHDIGAWCGIKFKNEHSNPLRYAGHLYKNVDEEYKDIIIPNSVISISDYAFYNATVITSLCIPESVTNIGTKAFYGCTGLTNIDIPNSINSIGGDAFAGCLNLTDLSIDCSVIYAWFAQMSNIKNVIIGNSVKGIRKNAFKDCVNLKNVKFGNSVTEIEYGVFDGCVNLTKVIVSDLATWCGIHFVMDDKGFYSSNPLMFAHHIYSDEDTEITRLIIPNGVKGIGEGAFYGCQELVSAEIPSSVTNIGNNAFADCESIEEVVSFVRMIFNINKNVFSNKTYLNATLYVPEGRKKAYEAATGWQNFVYMEEGVPAGIHDVLFDDSSDAVEVARYDSNGKIILAPTKGLNIIKYINGKVKKVYVR